MTLAKALAGGVAAGGMLARPEVAAALKPGMHAATFGGNPIACRAGLATIETIEADGLLERADAIGAAFVSFFQALQRELPVIKEIRFRGAMIGVELQAPAAPIVKACLERRLLINGTHDTVVRLLPALTITDEQIAEGCEILGETLRQSAS
jgi:acetylornithine/succinyldiaminopimelate/putrescine aminotransferase